MFGQDIVDRAGALSEKLIGKHFSPEQGIAFLKAVKAVAAVDGFSDLEWQAMQARMKELGLGQPIQDAIRDYDPHSESFEQILGAYPKDGPEARMLVLSAVLVSAADTHSEAEAAALRRVASILGVSDPMVSVLEKLADAQLLAEKTVRDQGQAPLDSELFASLLALRRAIFVL